ncbi:MAG: alpha/beta fold hydrolase [Actinobacteria bacterium]|nr:alpha/beta fold hydrolase [Actinomycetota bacterium]
MGNSMGTRIGDTDWETTGRGELLRDLPVEEQRLDVCGVTTSLLKGGRGRPLILLHGGIQAGGLVWWRVIPRLVSTHRVVVPDLPGLGESESAPGPLEPDWVADWLEELIRATCEEPPTLVAHSAPGAFATRFAIQQRDRLRRLVLVDSGGLARTRPPLDVLAAAIRSVARPSDRNFDRFMRKVMYDLDRVREQEGDRWMHFARYALERGTLRSSKKAMRSVVKGGLQAIPGTELRKVRTPVALIWGRHDRLLPLRIAESIVPAVGWPLHVIDDAGHLPHVEQPDDFIDTLQAVIGAA